MPRDAAMVHPFGTLTTSEYHLVYQALRSGLQVSPHGFLEAFHGALDGLDPLLQIFGLERVEVDQLSAPGLRLEVKDKAVGPRVAIQSRIPMVSRLERREATPRFQSGHGFSHLAVLVQEGFQFAILEHHPTPLPAKVRRGTPPFHPTRHGARRHGRSALALG